MQISSNTHEKTQEYLQEILTFWFGGFLFGLVCWFLVWFFVESYFLCLFYLSSYW